MDRGFNQESEIINENAQNIFEETNTAEFS